MINAVGIICFAVGERRAVKANGIDRPLPGIKLAVSAVMVIAALAAGGEYAKYYHSLSTVDIDVTDYDQYIMMADDPSPTSEGYGFPYEHGLSSVPLRPYYVENPENKLALLTEPSEFVITAPEKCLCLTVQRQHIPFILRSQTLAMKISARYSLRQRKTEMNRQCPYASPIP